MKSNIKKVHTSCNICGSHDSQLVTTGIDFEYPDTTDDVFHLVRCTNCNLVYLNPRPDVSEFNTIYPENYHHYQRQNIDNQVGSGNLYHTWRWRWFQGLLERTLKKFFPFQTQIRLLDIGCADGRLLNWFKKCTSHEIETSGVEMNSRVAEHARASGHTVYEGLFEEVELPAAHFDFVHASHIIEHVPDPKSFARKVFSILKPGGVFQVWTPNIGSMDAKLFQSQHWCGYHFPRHFYLFDSHTLKRLVEDAGFQEIAVDFYPSSIPWIKSLHTRLKSKAPISGCADLLFPDFGWYEPTLVNFMRNGFFAAVDSIFGLLAGQTSNMGASFRKPAVTEPDASSLDASRSTL